jgi:NHL repeat
LQGRLGALALALATLVLAALSPAAASADSTLCPKGSAAGQCANPQGVASDFGNGRIYVADKENNRIDVFEGNGEFEFAFGWGVDTGASALEKCTTASGCQKGLAGTGDGQLSGPRRVAVDNSAGPSQHDVYVFDSGNQRIEKFGPGGEFLGKVGKDGEGAGEFHDSLAQLAVASGDIYVGDTLGNFGEPASLEPRVEKFSEGLAFTEECKLSHHARLSNGLAVASGGGIYAAFDGGGGIFKFEPMPGCNAVGSPYPLDPTVEVRALGMDDAGNLYATQFIDGAKPARSFRVATKYSPAGTILRRYGFGSLVSANADPGIAPIAPVGNEVVVSEEFGAVKRLVEPPQGPVIARLEHVEPVSNVEATLEAEVDPEGKAAEYRFEYVDQKSFDEESGWASPNVQKTEEETLPGSPDFNLHLAKATIGCADPLAESAKEPGKTAIEAGECLIPEDEYHYRVFAKNADGEGNSPVEGTFETAPPLEIEDAFASAIGTDTAKLTMRVNPLGIPTTGFFEYVTQAQFEASEWAEATQVPNVGGGAGPLDFGSGEGGVTRSVTVELTPGTTYRMRARVTDPLIEEPLESEEIIFTTFKPEASERCPDNEAFRSGFSALLPDCRAYELVSPLDKEGGDIVSQLELLPELPAVLDQSSTSGEKLAYGAYRAFGDAKAAPRTSQYIAQRTPTGWQSHYILGPRGRLTQGVTGAFPSELRALSPDLCEAWIKTYAEPPLAPSAIAEQMNLYRRHDQAEDCGTEESWEALTTSPPPPNETFGTKLDFQGASTDGSKTIYVARTNLAVKGIQPPDTNGEQLALYYQEEGEGEPSFVCVLPNGAATSGGCGAGTTVQQNGSGRESNLTGAISADGSRVFWSTEPATVLGGPGKIYLRENPGAEQSGSGCEAGKACTIAVSEKGEELQGTSKDSRFWAATPEGTKALYSTGGTLYLFDVEGNATTAIAGGVVGVATESPDLSRIYFVSEEALPSEPNSEENGPVAGKFNLYLYEGGTLRYIAGLGSFGQAKFVLRSQRSARTTADGSHLAFISSEEPTGYDNTDASSPERCGPQAGPKARCDSEVFLYDATAGGGKGKLVCVSCNPSGGRPIGELAPQPELWSAALLPIWHSSLYPGRVLSDDGRRVYFESSEALAPRDTNGTIDVYQWEASGSGSCKESSPSFSAQDEGCVSLVSSGQGAGEATLLDASPSGNDVFFTTAQSLLKEDFGLVDAYDARVGGGLPEPPLPPTICEGEACQHPAPAPEDAPGTSLHYEGPGNLEEAKPRKKKCPKSKVRKHGHCVKKAKHKGKRSGGSHR